MSRLAARVGGLRRRLAETRRVWRRGAVPPAPAPAPAPAPPAVPPPAPHGTAHGTFDMPAPGETLPRGPVSLQGWMLFPSEPVVRIEAWIGERPLGPARIGLQRRDVLAAAGLPLAAVSGFEVTADLAAAPPLPAGPAEVRAVATSLSGERFEIAPVHVVVAEPEPEPEPAADPPLPTATAPADGDGRGLLVFTHQLDLGGAQLYLLDLLRGLIALGSFEPTVVSPHDGPLRRTLEELGVPVHLTSPIPVDDAGAHAGRVEELASWARGRGFELALVNTATTYAFPGVEVAAELGIPAVWAIHESYEPSILWNELGPGVRERAEAALAGAAALVFEAEATMRLFEPATSPGRCVTLNYGLDPAPIDRLRSGFDAGAARRRAGIPEDAEVVLCLGTVEPRKAQVPLALAFDAIAARHPRARLVFVGGRDDDHTAILRELADSLGTAERIEIVPVTPDVQTWLGLSDLLVCASDVESLPRSVLEAMAWELPVLATRVFGLPELIEDGRTGWLCEPRDVGALAEALDRALSSSAEGRREVGAAARSHVIARHDLEAYAREMAALFDRVAKAPEGPPPTAASARR